MAFRSIRPGRKLDHDLYAHAGSIPAQYIDAVKERTRREYRFDINRAVRKYTRRKTQYYNIIIIIIIIENKPCPRLSPLRKRKPVPLLDHIN